MYTLDTNYIDLHDRSRRLTHPRASGASVPWGPPSTPTVRKRPIRSQLKRWDRRQRDIREDHQSAEWSDFERPDSPRGEGGPLIDPAKLCEMVRELAIRAHRSMKRPPSLGLHREEIDVLLEEIDRLNQMISESHMHQTQLASWARNLRREVASRAIAAIATDPESIHRLVPSVVTMSDTHS